jgi:hypothetical protein
VDTVTAIVVCGGFGTRLGPALGSARCKSLLPIVGVPVLTYVLEALRQAHCSNCILSIDRADIASDIDRVGRASGLSYSVHTDSGRGPTAVAQEASFLVSSPRFLVLYGHQIVHANHLVQMLDADRDFVATTYADSSEGVRKIATIDAAGYCVALRRGSEESPPSRQEVYLDKPYVLDTETIRRSGTSSTAFDPRTPADADLRPHTILRYVSHLYTIAATFRHEFHYADELAEVAECAREFSNQFRGDTCR